MNNTQTSAETQSAKVLRFDSLEISEGFANRCERDDLDTAASILEELRDGIVTIETLSSLGDLLHEIASTANRIDSDHEAETCEALCEMVSQNLSAKYYKAIGAI
ncbi:hypothetical protein EBZ39_14685 [bacterium]|nr:hypothetical protein [bacterium]